MTPRRRLHPVAIMAGVGKELKNMVVPLLVIMVAGSLNRFSWRDFIVPLAAVVYTVVMGVLSWLRFTYAWDEDRLLVEEGVFVRKRRSIPFERIHGISVTEGIWQRMAGVVQVHVEAAGDALGEAEVTLRAISKEEARCLQRCVEQAKHKVGAAAHPEPSANRPHRALFALSAKEIGVASLTSGGALGVVAALCGFLSQLGDFIPYEALIRDLQSTWNGHGRLLIALFILSLLLAAYGVAIVQNMIRYASFVVRKQEDTIVIARGWLERKAVSVPVARVQGIVIHENWLRRLFGYASVSLIHAGGEARWRRNRGCCSLSACGKEESCVDHASLFARVRPRRFLFSIAQARETPLHASSACLARDSRHLGGIYRTPMGGGCVVGAAARGMDRHPPLSNRRMGAFVEAARASKRVVSANDDVCLETSRSIA